MKVSGRKPGYVEKGKVSLDNLKRRGRRAPKPKTIFAGGW